MAEDGSGRGEGRGSSMPWQILPLKLPWTIERIAPGLLRVFLLATGREFYLRVVPASE